MDAEADPSEQQDDDEPKNADSLASKMNQLHVEIQSDNEELPTAAGFGFIAAGFGFIGNPFIVFCNNAKEALGFTLGCSGTKLHARLA